MAEPTNIDEAIEQAALNPKKVKVRGTEIEEHDISELIEADKHQAAKKATSKNHMGLRFLRMKPGGTG